MIDLLAVAVSAHMLLEAEPVEMRENDFDQMAQICDPFRPWICGGETDECPGSDSDPEDGKCFKGAVDPSLRYTERGRIA